MTELKRSSKLLIYDSRHCLYCVYRAPGDWSNPNTISLIGADGDTLDGVLRQAHEKFRLVSEAGDRSVAGKVENLANNEINTVWTYARPVDSLLFVPAVCGGLFCLERCGCSNRCSRRRCFRSCGQCRICLKSGKIRRYRLSSAGNCNDTAFHLKIAHLPSAPAFDLSSVCYVRPVFVTYLLCHLIVIFGL